MNKFALLAAAAAAASVSALAQMRVSRPAAGSRSKGDSSVKMKIDHMPKPGEALVTAPAYQAQVAGNLQPPINKRPRKWALFELRYSTSEDWVDELTFTWHVLAQAEKAELNKSRKAAERESGGAKATVTPFSYYTATVRYVNIPRGSHMACVGLPPSTVEHFGRPVCVTVEITDKNGKSLEVRTEETMNISKADQNAKGRWWESETVMNNRNPNLKVERRNGLLDRSKTPFALINSSDYENAE